MRGYFWSSAWRRCRRGCWPLGMMFRLARGRFRQRCILLVCDIFFIKSIILLRGRGSLSVVLKGIVEMNFSNSLCLSIFAGMSLSLLYMSLLMLGWARGQVSNFSLPTEYNLLFFYINYEHRTHSLSILPWAIIAILLRSHSICVLSRPIQLRSLNSVFLIRYARLMSPSSRTRYRPLGSTLRPSPRPGRADDARRKGQHHAWLSRRG